MKHFKQYIEKDLIMKAIIEIETESDPLFAPLFGIIYDRINDLDYHVHGSSQVHDVEMYYKAEDDET